MVVDYLVPRAGGKSGSVQIYARNVVSALGTYSEVKRAIFYVKERGNSSTIEKLLTRHPDIIQIENRPLLLIPISKQVRSRDMHTKLVCSLHSLTFVHGKDISPKAMQRALSIADAVIVNSNAIKRQLTHLFPSVEKRIHVIYPGVDVTEFQPEASELTGMMTKSLSLSGRRPIVLFVGRLVKRKGLDIAIKAIQILRRSYPKTLLLVVGERSIGPSPKGFRNNGCVYYVGKVSHKEMPLLYNMADVLICPSQLTEAFGLVNVEAMASGLPVVASKNGGIPEVVKHGETGYLVNDYRNPESFAQCLSAALFPSKRLVMGEAGRQRAVAMFQWRNTVSALHKLYVDLLED